MIQFCCIAVDSIPPTVSCIDDFTRSIGLNLGGASVSWFEPTASDNSGVVSLASRTHAPGAFFAVGNTDVTYRFVDGSGNGASCTFTISVEEGKIA